MGKVVRNTPTISSTDLPCHEDSVRWKEELMHKLSREVFVITGTKVFWRSFEWLSVAMSSLIKQILYLLSSVLATETKVQAKIWMLLCTYRNKCWPDFFPVKCKDFERPQLVLGSAKPSRGNCLLVLSTLLLYPPVLHKFCYHTLTIEAWPGI